MPGPIVAEVKVQVTEDGTRALLEEIERLRAELERERDIARAEVKSWKTERNLWKTRAEREGLEWSRIVVALQAELERLK